MAYIPYGTQLTHTYYRQIQKVVSIPMVLVIVQLDVKLCKCSSKFKYIVVHTAGN